MKATEHTSAEDSVKEAYASLIAGPVSNAVHFKPGETITTPPATAEELRLRHRRLGLAWEMAKSRRGSRAWLPDRCVDAFRKLSDHVLGSKIAGPRLSFAPKNSSEMSAHECTVLPCIPWHMLGRVGPMLTTSWHIFGERWGHWAPCSLI